MAPPVPVTTREARGARLARRLGCAAALAGAIAALAACGGSANDDSSSNAAKATVTAVPTLAKLLPPAIRSSKVIRLQTEVGYAPYEVYAADGKTIQGLDVDLWDALEPILGVTFKPQDGTYANIIPALQAKRADVGWSAMALSSFVGLSEAKFLVYEVRSFTGLVVRADDSSIKTATDLCGKTLGYTNGESATTAAVDPQCKKLGKPPIQIKRFQKTPDIIVAVQSGKVDGRIVDSVNGNYFVKQTGGTLKFVPNVLPRHDIPTGIAVPAGDGQLLTALQRGLQTLVDNGTYAKILSRWGATDTAVPKITVAYKYAG